MEYVFLDANIYLHFYQLPSADLEELRKLVALVEQTEIRLYVTDQVVDEVVGNRPRVIAQALSEARAREPRGGFHQLLRNYDTFPSLDKAGKELSKQLNALLERLEEDALAEVLPADKLLTSLFASAVRLKDDDEVLRLARDRMTRRRPPGKHKDSSHGDAINWEALLREHPSGEVLHLISADEDFQSPLGDRHLHEFLRREWAQSKNSEIHLYRYLGDYLKEKHPQIKVADDVRRRHAITALASSGSFASTHLAVAQLQQIPTFSPGEVEELFLAARTNTQVRWVLGDDDVAGFYRRLIDTMSDGVDEVARATVMALMTELEPGEYPGRGPRGRDLWDGTDWQYEF